MVNSEASIELLPVAYERSFFYIKVVRTTEGRVSLKAKSDGNIYLNVPHNYPLALVRGFVDQHVPTLIKHSANKRNDCKLVVTDKTFQYFGEMRKFSVLTGFALGQVRLKNKMFYVQTQMGTNEEVTTVLTDFLHEELKKCLLAKVKLWAKKMGNTANRDLIIKDAKSAWGINYGLSKPLIFNLRLVHLRLELLDYLIVHELCHDFLHGHSAQFWVLVAKYLPNYQDLRTELNRFVL